MGLQEALRMMTERHEHRPIRIMKQVTMGGGMKPNVMNELLDELVVLRNGYIEKRDGLQPRLEYALERHVQEMKEYMYYFDAMDEIKVKIYELEDKMKRFGWVDPEMEDQDNTDDCCDGDRHGR